MPTVSQTVAGVVASAGAVITALMMTALLFASIAHGTENTLANEQTTELDSSMGLVSSTTPFLIYSLPAYSTTYPENQTEVLATKLDRVQPQGQSKFGGEFYSLNQISASDLKNNEGTTTSYNYIGLQIKLDDDQSLSIRQPYTYQFISVPETQSHFTVGKMNDVILKYAHGKMATFGTNEAGKIMALAKIELPTGDDSRLVTKCNGSAQTQWSVQYSVGKIDYSLGAAGALYNQTQDYHVREGFPDARMAHVDYTYYPYGEIDVSLTQKWAFSQTVGTENSIYRPIDNEPRQETHFYSASTTLTYSPTSTFRIEGGFTNQVDIGQPSKPFGLMRDEDLTYLLSLSVKI
jgi:hypothetical protein